MKVSPEDHNAKNALTLGGLSARQLLFSVVFVFLKGWCESFFLFFLFFFVKTKGVECLESLCLKRES